MAAQPRKLLSDTEQAAWIGFLTVHSLITRELDSRLVAVHRMPLVEYEVLLKLSIAGGRMRMSELADAALLSRSGLTRIVDELEALQLITREPDDSDGRVLIATLTAAGSKRFLAARRTHLANLRQLFLDRLSDEQVAGLGEIWHAIAAHLPPESGRRQRRSRQPGRARAPAG
jgi:DNA-binding MarR family transcriptional regulator